MDSGASYMPNEFASNAVVSCNGKISPVMTGSSRNLEITIVGAGLAGSEAAFQAAERGINVRLYEMRPKKSTGAHVSADFAELVCSNSLGSNMPDRPSGLLKEELRQLNSLLVQCAEATSLPAGSALAVDRNGFSQMVTKRITSHPNIEVVREEVLDIPEGIVVIASGPLTSIGLAKSISDLTGENYLFFYDAISPIVSAQTINMDIAFRGSRYRREVSDGGDYINCPFDGETYAQFIDALLHAEKITIKEFEREIHEGVRAGIHEFFEGCLPVEEMARRGPQTLAFGPMRPIGLYDSHTGARPYAVVQLRQDNLAGDLYNIVGFQTNLTYSEQKRVFRLIPGLEKADFVRYGQMHRNTFIASPKVLNPNLFFRQSERLLFAGQIVGVEGYMGNIATGLVAGINAARRAGGEEAVTFPATTMIGALTNYIAKADLADFQPMKANMGILPPLETVIKSKKERAISYSQRALRDLSSFMQAVGLN